MKVAKIECFICMKKDFKRKKQDFNRIIERPKKVKNKYFPVIIAFTTTLLITLTVGFIALFAVRSHNSDAAHEESTIEKSLFTKVPEGEVNFADIPRSDSVPGDETLENNSEEITEDTDGSAIDTEDVNEAPLSEDYWHRTINAASEDCVSLAFAGDILFDPGYAIMNRIRQNGGAISGVIGQSLLSVMNNADIMVVNNEFPYSTRGIPTEGKTFTFRAEPSSAALLNDMGVDVATLANNHAYDYGADALVDTLTTLDNVGVAHIGAGNNIEEASHPIFYTSQSGIKIAIISTTQIERLDNPDTKGATDTAPGVFRCLDISRLLQEIEEAKAEGYFVIVCIHWGTENEENIDWWQEKQGPEIVNAGADLIIGGHPHILQKIDYINGVPVVYSLGNYLFNSKTLETGLICANIYADKSVSLKFVPALQSGCTVNEATGEDRLAIIGHMRAISQSVNIGDDGTITSK